MAIYEFVRKNIISASIYNFILKIRCSTVKSFIFCATTGRSGTETLSRLINVATNVRSLHEPYPKMKNDTTLRYGMSLKDVFYTIKRIAIRRNSIGFDHYFEANHLFITNYADYAVDEFGKKIKVIHLRRDPVSVAKSFFSIDSIPGMTSSGRKWMPDPLDSNNVLCLTSLWDKLTHPFYRCLWFWYEVEARIVEFKKRYPFVEVYFLQTKDLNNLNKITELFSQFEFKYDKIELADAVGKHYNVKSSRKRIKIDDEKAKEMHDKFSILIKDKWPDLIKSIWGE